MKTILHLNLKKEYFEEIKSGKKTLEYRLKTDFWKKRLLNREYDQVHFKCGYPKLSDTSKIIRKKYLGYREVAIRHKHFNNTGATDPQVEVFAIHTTGEEIKWKQY